MYGSRSGARGCGSQALSTFLDRAYQRAFVTVYLDSSGKEANDIFHPQVLVPDEYRVIKELIFILRIYTPSSAHTKIILDILLRWARMPSRSIIVPREPLPDDSSNIRSDSISSLNDVRLRAIW